jgi:transcriptional regulator with XRE-family HTH domain
MGSQLPAETSNVVGRALVAARKQAGLDRDELARLIGAVAASVGRWERGDVLPQKRFWSGLLEHLGVDVRALSRTPSRRPVARVVQFPQPEALADDDDIDEVRSRLTGILFGGLENGNATSSDWMDCARVVARMHGFSLPEPRSSDVT